jgi:hypothetical protein
VATAASSCPGAASAVAFDLGILRPIADRTALTTLHPGVMVEQRSPRPDGRSSTANLAETAPPTYAELAVLRDLNERTARAQSRNMRLH